MQASIQVIVDLQERLRLGAENENLKSHHLLLSKHEVDVLYGLLCTTIDYHGMTERTIPKKKK